MHKRSGKRLKVMHACAVDCPARGVVVAHCCAGCSRGAVVSWQPTRQHHQTRPSRKSHNKAPRRLGKRRTYGCIAGRALPRVLCTFLWRWRAVAGWRSGRGAGSARHVRGWQQVTLFPRIARTRMTCARAMEQPLAVPRAQFTCRLMVLTEGRGPIPKGGP